MGGKRKPKTDHHVWVDYSLGWSENRDCQTSMRGDLTEVEAMDYATEQTDEMRRRGAESPVRSVRVTYWESGTSLLGAPVLYKASYYDAEQKLTDAEVYAARVHDWHETFDRFNYHGAANGSDLRIGYPDWTAEWGLEPTACPACNRALSPQNMY